MRENPRPTRHLEQLETAQLGKLAPGSVSGPAWDLVALPAPPDGGVPDAAEADVVAHRFAPAQPTQPAGPAGPAPRVGQVAPSVPDAPVAASAESVTWPSPTSPSTPSTALRRLTMVAVGCGVLAAFALGIGGLTMLWAGRPDAGTTGPVERTALDLPLIPADDPHDAREGERTETRLRDAGDAEAGEPREDGADANLLGDGTAPSGDQLEQGGEGAPGAGTSTGGSGSSGGSGSDPGSGAGGGTGSGGGGTTTPTDGPPPPTSDPTTDPTQEPTPKPTPTASEEPSPEPTPSPTVSPTPTPTGAPVSPNAGG